MTDGERLRVGYIPLVAAAALIVAAIAPADHEPLGGIGVFTGRAFPSGSYFRPRALAMRRLCVACERISLPNFCAAQSFRNRLSWCVIKQQSGARRARWRVLPSI